MFKFKINEYINYKYKKNINGVDYNIKYSKFLTLFYRYFLVDDKGYMRYLKYDNFLSKRII